MKNFRRIAGALTGALMLPWLAHAATAPVKIRMSDNGDFLVPLLAQNLGYFQQEGLELVRMHVTDVAPEDWLMQKALTTGQLDASYHWFQHTIYGVRHNFPIQAVILLNDAPGAKVMVATRLQGQIRSAADFKGRHVAEGMGYATKSMLTSYLAQQAGLPKHSYTPVFPESAGRLQAVSNGLKAGRVDVVTFMEPMTSAIEATGLVTTLYDLTSKEGTVKALGAPYPGQSILMAPAFIAAHPDTVQHLVNAMVRAMRYINSHTAEEIIAHLPPEYFKTADHQAELEFVRKTLPSFARGDYSFAPAAVQLVVNNVLTSDFDDSPEGVWRRTVENPHLMPAELYTNRFVKKAMKEIK
ncbi:MAG: ABC transporter substrate-binding protein [Opitutaceae bacterium]